MALVLNLRLSIFQSGVKSPQRPQLWPSSIHTHLLYSSRLKS
jgi:hypothetical protein